MKMVLILIVAIILCFSEVGGGVLDDLEAVVLQGVDRKDCRAAEDMVCPRQDITFWLYTRSIQNSPILLSSDDLDSLSSAPWVVGALKIVVHGYTKNKDEAVNRVLRPAYFANGEYNIISMDWGPLCQDGCYYQSTKNVPTVAHCLAQFITNLLTATNFSSVHLLGHSLGAHVCTWASCELPYLHHLTEFDPAFPLYSDMSKNLKRSAAAFTDVYHSNSWVEGRPSQDGDIDVYFNNAVLQPGCGCDISCSHLMAVKYYAESIATPERMKAFPCAGWKIFLDECPMPEADDLVTVGENCNSSSPGSYVIFTNKESPFLPEPSVYLDNTSFYQYKNNARGDCDAFSILDFLLKRTEK